MVRPLPHLQHTVGSLLDAHVQGSSHGLGAFGIMFFILVFYALALFDRWLKLRADEMRRQESSRFGVPRRTYITVFLATRMTTCYGAISVGTSSHSTKSGELRSQEVSQKGLTESPSQSEGVCWFTCLDSSTIIQQIRDILEYLKLKFNFGNNYCICSRLIGCVYQQIIVFASRAQIYIFPYSAPV
jgi:hypothetical protein